MPTAGPIPQLDLFDGVANFIAAHSDLLQQKVDGKGKSSPAADSTKKNNAALGNYHDDFQLAVVSAIEKGLISAPGLDNRGTPVVSPSANSGGGTAVFELAVNRDFGVSRWLRIVSDAASVSGQLDIYSDVARTKLIYSAVFVGTSHIEATPWTAIADDASNLEAQTLYCTVTNTGGANSTYSTEIVFQG